MSGKDISVWERVKNEIPRCQFDEIVRMRDRLMRKGWGYIKAESNGLSVVLTVKDPTGKTHWLNVSPDGESVFLPTVMACK